jgi:protease-4
MNDQPEQVTSSAQSNQENLPQNPPAQPTPPFWEKEVLQRILFSQIKEQRAARITKTVFRSLYVLIIIYVLVLISTVKKDADEIKTYGPHTALVKINGVIDAEGDNSAETIIINLENAFEDAQAKAIILAINSPGGSPVQSGMVYDEINRFREKYPNKPIYTVVGDICASGAYYIAAATDKIYVDKASIVGSIGVIMDGFGFVDAMKKVGVERRMMTSGENKGMLDPFSPSKPEEVQYVQSMLTEVHQQFITAVKNGRKDRLSSDPTLFSGLFWSGAKSIDLGLSDGFGSVRYVAKEIIGEPTLVEYNQKGNFVEALSKRIGLNFGHAIVQSLSESTKLH